MVMVNLRGRVERSGGGEEWRGPGGGRGHGQESGWCWRRESTYSPVRHPTDAPRWLGSGLLSVLFPQKALVHRASFSFLGDFPATLASPFPHIAGCEGSSRKPPHSPSHPPFPKLAAAPFPAPAALFLQHRCTPKQETGKQRPLPALLRTVHTVRTVPRLPVLITNGRRRGGLCQPNPAWCPAPQGHPIPYHTPLLPSASGLLAFGY